MIGGSRRRLSEEEHQLWTGFTRSIAPLRPDRTKDLRSEPTSKPTATHKPRAPGTRSTAQVPGTIAPLGRRMRQRIARGSEGIDARLDLHGQTQAEAHAALLSFLRRAQREGARNILLITGKGGREGETGRGVLRRVVPLWLRLPEFARFIVGFEQAHVAHGGEGALYVRLRKA